MSRRCAFLLFLAVFGASGPGTAGAADPARVGFNRDIRPILSDKCFLCHGPDAAHRKAKLRFDVEADAKRDRDGHRAIADGDSAGSELVRRITSADPDERMPPPESGKELDAREIELLRRWIDQGAIYQRHWSYIPPQRPSLPGVADETWPLGAIDRFILARLEAEGLQPSPQADPATLVRRLHFDLIGLPPRPEAVDASTSHPDRARAYEELVDGLLASPRYGERMAMYWLDLVRYADTVGYHGDQDHNASPYRDYVIKAFKDNMRFDRFTAEQLAGDLLPNATVDQKIASGYNRLLQTTHEGGAQAREYLAKYASDRVRNVSTVWMGGTMGCSECHNHKYDPYTQRDFYSLAAFFADVEEKGDFAGSPNSLPTTRPPEIEVISPLDREALERVGEEIVELQKQLTTTEASAALAEAKARLAELEKRRDTLAKRKRKQMITVSVEPRTVRVLGRGDWMDTSGPIVDPGVPEFVKHLAVEGRRATRLDLARWLTSADHPQTARIFVNRLWYLFFGVGLSKVLDDTGSQGEWPTHPALLDWLAVEFVESGWNVKHVVKLLVMSRTYRQSSLASEAQRRRDPENRLFARQARFRLPAEMVRDNALAVSGLLLDRIGGPSARPYQPAGYYAHLNFPQRKYKADRDLNQYRRGVYTHWQRQFLHPMLRAFDAPTREECTVRRNISNTPLAALVLLNDPTFVEAARVFGQRILNEGGKSTRERVRWAWRRALSRNPDDREAAVLGRLLELRLAQFRKDEDGAKKLLSVGLAQTPSGADIAELAAWAEVARAILNLNETITRN